MGLNCRNLSKAIVLKDFLNDIYSVAAQYDEPPDYPVSKICGAIDGDGASSYSSDILGRISAGVAAAFAGQNMSCYDVKYFDHLTQTRLGWRWQVTLISLNFMLPTFHNINLNWLYFEYL